MGPRPLQQLKGLSCDAGHQLIAFQDQCPETQQFKPFRQGRTSRHCQTVAVRAIQRAEVVRLIQRKPLSLDIHSWQRRMTTFASDKHTVAVKQTASHLAFHSIRTAMARDEHALRHVAQILPLNKAVAALQ